VTARASGARRGLGAWLAQRASALAMALLAPVFLAYAVAHAPLGYAGWRALFQPLAVRIGALLFVAALLIHAWTGLKEILIDYVHRLGLRLALHFLFGLAYAGCLVWAADILWGAA